MLSFQKTVQILFVGDAKTFKIVNAMDLLEELDTEVQAAAASMSEEVSGKDASSSEDASE